MSRVDANFITDDCTDREFEVLFGPFTGEEVTFKFEKTETISHLLHKAGLIKSLSWGRQNGWAKPIPEGFSEFTFGKLKHRITIFNKKEEILELTQGKLDFGEVDLAKIYTEKFLTYVNFTTAK